MAIEEPEVLLDVELGHDMALAVFARLVIDVENAVHHQHRRRGELGILRPPHLAFAGSNQFVVGERTLAVSHMAGRLRRKSTARAGSGLVMETRLPWLSGWG